MLKVVLKVIQGLFQLDFELGEVLSLVLLGLEVIQGLRIELLQLLLLAAELADQLVVDGHLLSHGAQFVLHLLLVLLPLAQFERDGFNLLLHLVAFLLRLHLLGLHLPVLVGHILHALLDFLQLGVQFGLLLQQGIHALLAVQHDVPLVEQQLINLVLGSHNVVISCLQLRPILGNLLIVFFHLRKFYLGFLEQFLCHASSQLGLQSLVHLDPPVVTQLEPGADVALQCADSRS